MSFASSKFVDDDVPIGQLRNPQRQLSRFKTKGNDPSSRPRSRDSSSSNFEHISLSSFEDDIVVSARCRTKRKHRKIPLKCSICAH